MDEQKIKGIVISSKDYKDNDKILTIFSLEKGIIYAKIVGVKKPNAKLKAVKEIFCFADFELVSRGDFSTVTSASIIETFYNITTDIDKFYSGCTVLEILKTIGRENQPNQILFVETLKILQMLAYEDVNPKLLEMRFLIDIFKAMGYQLSLNYCSSCGEEFRQKRFFEPNEGEIVCNYCKSASAIEISPLVHNALRLTADCELEKIRTLKFSEDAISSALSLLKENFKFRFDHELKNI